MHFFLPFTFLTSSYHNCAFATISNIFIYYCNTVSRIRLASRLERTNYAVGNANWGYASVYANNNRNCVPFLRRKSLHITVRWMRNCQKKRGERKNGKNYHLVENVAVSHSWSNTKGETQRPFRWKSGSSLEHSRCSSDHGVKHQLAQRWSAQGEWI